MSGAKKGKEILNDEHKRCYFCESDISGSLCYPEKGRWTIHHIDGHKFNNEEFNLAWAHQVCHAEFEVKKIRGLKVELDKEKEKLAKIKELLGKPICDSTCPYYKTCDGNCKAIDRVDSLRELVE